MACIAKRRGRYVTDFYDNQGKRRWKTLPEGCTKTKAKEVLREIEDQLSKGVYLPEKKIPTFKEVAADWLEYKKPNVRESTWRKYEGYIRQHFDEILHIKINRINTARAEKYIIQRQNEGMNLTTLRKLIVTFNQIMNYAVRHNYIDHNPVRDAERPRGQGGEEESSIRIFSTAEISAFLDADKDEKYRTLFMLAIMSGARQGELIGLKWTDVDWFNKQLHIQRTFNEGAWYKPKTRTSNRKIDLGPSMITQMKKWRLACPPNESDLIFPNEAGNPMNHGNMLRRHFYPALKKAGIPKMRFHDLRHTYASLLIEQGENIKYIQSQLGHASPMVTLTTYAHLMKPVNQESACKLEESIFQNNGSKMVAEK
ncbi:MAG: tyrosine-type recombinase/integrase [Desulfococcaceae bacterium]|jgi:integrase|nr:tyrosine-type recombinase/integrase [Desulfococcaceae bacterium]